jgi:hypothetical protein
MSETPIVFDTGASVSVSPREDDFVSWESKGDQNHYMNGLSASTKVLGVGKVRWTIYDDKGFRRDIVTRAYYVPAARVRLLSPQRLFAEQKSGKFVLTHGGCVFTFPGNEKHRLTFKQVDDHLGKADLPIAYTAPKPTTLEKESDDMFARLNVLDPGNANVTSSQKELLLWHFKLGHFHLAWIQNLFRV